MTKERNTNLFSVFHIARIVLQTVTPLSIASGQTDTIHDNLLVRDANDLPAIPGSCFAGVLRSLYENQYGQEETEALFGTAKHKEVQHESPSLVGVSWGCIHDAKDLPVEGLLDPENSRFRTDALLRDARQIIPVRRDHVQISDKGVALKREMAKFDRVSLTAGHRFSIELSLWSNENPDPRWYKLLDMLQHPEFRLGGNTRRGLGSLKVKRCYANIFDLGDTDDLEKFRNISPLLSEYAHLSRHQVEGGACGRDMIVLKLTPEDDGYRFGGGLEPLSNNDTGHPPDLIPVTEKEVEWRDNKGSISSRKVLIPATALKGPLRHRTAYYYNLLTGEKVDADRCKAVTRLFGYVKRNNDSAESQAKAGNLLIDDQYQPLDSISSLHMEHTSIDRFTGGVREHMLFSEELVVQKCTPETPLAFKIYFLEDRELLKQEEPLIMKALEFALDDLKNGRLALGAGSGRVGSGYFQGSWHWKKSDQNEKKRRKNNEI